MAQAVRVRVLMVNGMFDLPEETKHAMGQVRALVAQCAADVAAVCGGVQCDTGRLIATLDLLQQVKNTACDAMILPHAPKGA